MEGRVIRQAAARDFHAIEPDTLIHVTLCAADQQGALGRPRGRAADRRRVWVSAYHTVRITLGCGLSASLGCGLIGAGVSHDPPSYSARGRIDQLNGTPMLLWLPRFDAGKGSWFAIPLWIPAVAILWVSAAAWRRKLVARRRHRAGLCPECGYTRSGLPPGSRCPECGC